ncbi:accessory gland-specific peptide 57Da [Drosophila rhopaloa]|uniref:Accessory gland-specific peptide 57Da n=1 Tax=Drosophila rhopaloa TaxID=1041015 RepID=A0A6P4DZX7_DRORH|nr:accessory gland-specific peptide 57Da [Drosophila rhopaloa]
MKFLALLVTLVCAAAIVSGESKNTNHNVIVIGKQAGAGAPAAAGAAPAAAPGPVADAIPAAK